MPRTPSATTSATPATPTTSSAVSSAVRLYVTVVLRGLQPPRSPRGVGWRGGEGVGGRQGRNDGPTRAHLLLAPVTSLAPAPAHTPTPTPRAAQAGGWWVLVGRRHMLFTGSRVVVGGWAARL